jgi:hypothetical protein
MTTKILRTRAASELVTPETAKKAAAILGLDAAETIARRIKDPVALENALVAKLEAQREFAAEYKREFPQAGNPHNSARSGRISSDEWCLAHGFAYRTVARWCELLDELLLQQKKGQVLKKCWQLAELWQAANFLSESVEWYTPKPYIRAVVETLGGIDLDPASSGQANESLGAKAFFTRDDNGLQHEWKGRFFLNPPYGLTPDGKSLAAEFCKKAISEFECGNAVAGIILVNSLHSQQWQAPLYRFPICFVDHRIQFVSGDGEKNKNPTFQNIFIYLGTESHRFASAFRAFGYVMVPYVDAV